MALLSSHSTMSTIAARDTKLGIISDLHMKLEYDPTTSKNKCGNSGNKFFSFKNLFSFWKDAEPVAPLGRIGCDAPPLLVDYMLQLFEKVNAGEPVDYVILNGDLIAHGIAQKAFKTLDTQKYDLLKRTHTEVQELFTKHMPNTPVFLTLGNNDCKYHDNSPFKEDKEEFYGLLYDLWFKNHPGNKAFASAVESTFKDGGYYKIDVNDKLSLLAINTLPYNKD